MRKTVCLLVFAVVTPTALSAQSNPLSDQARYLEMGARLILMQSADRMPESEYNFRPVAEVRTYGQIIGHIADNQYFHCSAVRGEKDPNPEIEKNKHTKAELKAALDEAIKYCDKAYASITDAHGSDMVTFMGSPIAKLGLLEVHQLHNMLHYGNLITYMRMKGILPPTSDPALRLMPGK